MIVLNKKRISIILSAIFISLFTFLFVSEKNINNSTIPTVSLPVSGKTIVLDAGHGVPDERSAKFKWNYRSRN